MSNICRLCLRNDEHIRKQNIFDLYMSDTLYWVFGVEVDITDTFSKWVCQKCLDIIIYVKKLKKFFQTNQYLLREKKCPLDFDIEFMNLTVDIGTQTNFQHKTHTPNPKKFGPLTNLNTSDDINTISKHIQTIKRKRIANSTEDQDNSSETHIPIPKELIKSHFFPEVLVPKLEDVYASLGYQRIEPTVYKELRQVPVTVKIEEDTNNFEECSRIAEPKQLSPKQITTRYKTIGTTTELILGCSHLENDSDIIRNHKRNAFEKNVPIIDTISKPPKSDYISVPINVFDSFGVPYVEVKRLESNPKLKQILRHPKDKIEKKNSSLTKKKKSTFLDYYYRIPTSALSELISERNEAVSGKKKVVQKEKSLFKIKDVFHVESCDICHQVFKSKERLSIHQDIRHKESRVSLKNNSQNTVLMRMLKYRNRLPRRINRVGACKNESTDTASSDEEVDVTTINRSLNLPIKVPDVVLFDENAIIDNRAESRNLIHDHDYVKFENPIDSELLERNDVNLNCDTNIQNFNMRNNMSSSMNTDGLDLLFKINKTKYEIKIWEKIKDFLLDDYTNGTLDMETKFNAIISNLTESNVKEEPIDCV